MTEDKTVRRFQSCVAFRGANVGRQPSGVGAAVISRRTEVKGSGGFLLLTSSNKLA